MILGTLIIGSGLITVSIKYLRFKYDEIRIHKWLKSNSHDKIGSRFRSTRTIASQLNLTLDRTPEVCSKSKNIRLSTGKKDGMWTLREYYISPDEEDDKENFMFRG